MRGNDTQMMAKMGEGEAMNHSNETALMPMKMMTMDMGMKMPKMSNGMESKAMPMEGRGQQAKVTGAEDESSDEMI
ncbi:hypothetical protein niasHS_009939 [Heterodera schachtii]|uniref:Uncharacterized protein n=1 Tax=Heterodera schachtii TaxID=97005 RepID=A0ABD2JCY9_HETSC